MTTPKTSQEIDAFREQLNAVFIDSISPNAHIAMSDFKDGLSAAGCIATAVDREKRQRDMWINIALDPWAKRHGLTRSQALSVAFDDSQFNPNDKTKDQVTMASLFWGAGQHNNFVAHLRREHASIEMRADSLPSTLVMRRWDVEEGSVGALLNEPVYKIEVKPGNACFSVNVSPDMHLPDGIEKWPELRLGIEVIEGLPCVHIHTGSVDELQATIFGMPDGGIMIRNGDSGPIEDKIAPKGFVPDLEAAEAVFASAAQGSDLSAAQGSDLDKELSQQQKY